VGWGDGVVRGGGDVCVGGWVKSGGGGEWWMWVCVWWVDGDDGWDGGDVEGVDDEMDDDLDCECEI